MKHFNRGPTYALLVLHRHLDELAFGQSLQLVINDEESERRCNDHRCTTVII